MTQGRAKFDTSDRAVNASVSYLASVVSYFMILSSVLRFFLGCERQWGLGGCHESWQCTVAYESQLFCGLPLEMLTLCLER